jgi:hypothetical protein
MRGKGIALDATRAGYYERTLAEIADYHERGTVDDLIARRRVLALINVLSESTEFVDIHTGLSRASDPQIQREFTAAYSEVTLAASKCSDSLAAYEFNNSTACARVRFVIGLLNASGCSTSR